MNNASGSICQPEHQPYTLGLFHAVFYFIPSDRHLMIIHPNVLNVSDELNCVCPLDSYLWS